MHVLDVIRPDPDTLCLVKLASGLLLLLSIVQVVERCDGDLLQFLLELADPLPEKAWTLTVVLLSVIARGRW